MKLSWSVIAGALAISSAAHADLAKVKSSGVLRWGGDIQGGEPYVYRDPKDPSRLVGFEVDIADAIAKRLGVRAEFTQADWANLVPSLERGDFDVALNGLEVMPDRAARILFTRPYYVFAERLMARKGDARIKASLAALAGLRVATLTNSLGFELARGKCDVVPYDGAEEPYQDLVNERVDAVLNDDILAARYGMPKPELVVVGDIAEGQYAIGVRKSEPELHAAVDGALEAMIASGELRAILERAGLWNERQTHTPAPVVAAAEPARFSLAEALLFLRGAGMTLLVSTLAMLVAVPLGMALALTRLYARPLFQSLAGAYVEVYRGTPVLLQLYVLYFGLAPVMKLGPITAAVLGLGMNYAAYEAETYRGAIQSVPKGQLEAATCLGMSFRLALRRVVLPQAFRQALPNVTNDYIALLKDSSLVSVIAVVELTKQMTITAVDVRSWLLPGALCAILYFAMSYPLALLARRIEKKLEGEKQEAEA